LENYVKKPKTQNVEDTPKESQIIMENKEKIQE
jgi:hypothetical protein